MPWYSLTVDLPGPASELAEALLHECGASGLETRDDATKLMPGSRAPKAGEAIVVGYFDKKTAAAKADKRLKREFREARTSIEAVVQRDWSVEWRSQIRSVTVGRLWVGPPWERETAPRDKVCLFIEPKMAFGTGDHPTTSLCLAAVDAYMGDGNRGASVLDVGTGTGVLAFAAKKLGAMRVVGIDNDPMAVELAKECATENGLTDLDLSTRTVDQVEGSFDLVLANILANTLVQLAPAIARKTKHRLVLAGVLVPQADEVRAAYEKQGLKSVGAVEQGEWVRLDFERP